MQILFSMSHPGRAMAAIDESRYFLANPAAPPYIRSFMKRV